jgi:type IV pilus assembly protein PilN
MDVIHKKNGKLHIYVRQDKYKGELRSHNWVGRTYIDGKQKIISSKTTDLEKATVILEKWFDDLQLRKIQSNDISKIEDNIPKDEVTSKIVDSNPSKNTPPSTKSNLSIFEKLKKINISKLSLGKKNAPISGSKKITIQNKFKNYLNSFFKAKLGKMSVTSEEVVGVDITADTIRVAQVSKNKGDRWILDKYSYRSLDKEKIGDNLIDSKDYLAAEIPLALANAKITTKNVAISIPVTSAFIKVVTSPFMTDEEMKRAIETGSLWENLVEMDNINDYSVFHQVIERNSKKNTMEILFVASKLSDVNAYSSIVKKAGLNPVIMDVRCFSLKNAFDNTKLNKDNIKQTAILEFGLSENYLMIIYNNMPIVKDIFLKPQEREMLAQANEAQQNNPEVENIIRRYSMQIKQILNEHENKYQTKINAINVVSSLKNIKYLIPQFTKNLQNTGFKLFEPLTLVSIPTYNQDKINLDDNKSTMASVMGLAYRKLDIFGYYKFVTAVRNINLLPNRDAVRQQNKIKFLSGFAFKGLAITIAIIYFVLIGYSTTQYYFNKEKLLAFDEIKGNYERVSARFNIKEKKFKKMEASLKIGQNLNSNQAQSYRAMAQVARSVPGRVKPTKIEYDGGNQMFIEGLAYENGDVRIFNKNLKQKSLIKLAQVGGTTSAASEQTKSTSMKRSFTIKITLDFSESSKGD